MGYTTDFDGELKFNRELTEKEASFIKKLATTRRMKRNIGPEFGVEGEFYVDDEPYGMGFDDSTVIDNNNPPSTQPGLWCQWIVTDDRQFLEWDGGEKFYNYVEWLEYIINSVLPHIVEEGDEPLSLTGAITWAGEEPEDLGRILVNNNVVTVQEAKISYEQRF